MDQKSMWHAALGELEVTISRANFSTWFRNTSILSHEDGHVIISVPNLMTKTWLEGKFHADIHAVLSKMSTGVKTIEYRVGAAPEVPYPPQAQSVPEPPKRSENSTATRRPSVMQTSMLSKKSVPVQNNLNPRYTFENFVVGSSNELAYAAAQAVAKSPGTKYNPLYLYGGVGLGKTHLMQAVGNYICDDDPSKRIEYVSSESFTNEFIDAIQKKKNTAFTDKYRSVDVLIIDDMQFLAGKEKTQDEFFHTFNALHQSNKQIIISSDKPPQLLTTLEERLRSRFAMGMTADIQAPDLETRQAILQTKANAQGIILPLETIDYLARHAQHNIRELEGVLTQFLAFCELRGLQPNVSAATQLLAGQAQVKPKNKPLQPKIVIERVANYFDLNQNDITGTKRDKEIVLPRQITMYLMRHDLGLSFPKIAQAVGGRDHTTAMHSVTKIEKALDNDSTLREDIEALRAQMTPV